MNLRADDQGRLDFPIRILEGDKVVAYMVRPSDNRGSMPGIEEAEALQMALRMTQAFNAYKGVYLIPQQVIKEYLEARVVSAPESQQAAFQEALTVLCGQPRSAPAVPPEA